jgi:hypothetical protein
LIEIILRASPPVEVYSILTAKIDHAGLTF